MQLAKNLTGNEIGRELIHIISTDHNIGSNHLLAAMRDRASTKEVAMRTVMVLYLRPLDVGDTSPTLLTLLVSISTQLLKANLEYSG